jgi:uncharacterized protein (DUF2164 family)
MKSDERYLAQPQLAELAGQVQQYLASEHQLELGGFDAQALALFVAERIGPAIYNKALADARSALDARMESLQSALWELERS